MYSVYDIQALPWMGCPIRTSPDHSLFSGSPKLIAASHVLLRLSTPRHPPIALSSLTISPCFRKLLRTRFFQIQLSKSTGNQQRSPGNLGGGERIRTDDPLRAKQALFRLSYTPDSLMVGLVGVEPTTSRLSGVRSDRN
jgi:hypothetical protein